MRGQTYIARTSVTVLLLLLGLAGVAQAVDGVVLISQNSALAGNVTSGDAPGFPVTITQPGSYRLSGDLTVPAGVDGIVVNSDNVTIDLNGFAIVGHDLGVPGGQPFGIRDVRSCNQISFPDVTVCHTGITVRNGAVTGFFSGVDLLFASAIVTDVHANNNTNIGIRVSSPGVIRDSVANNNGAGIVVLNCPVLIANNSAMNTGANILVAPSSPNSCVVINNAAP